MPELAPLSSETVEALRKTSAATVTGLLARRGLRRATIAGARPIVPGTKMVGEAFTLRYIPAREDLDWTGTLDNLTDAQRVAIERVGPGQVLVIDARGDVLVGDDDGVGVIPRHLAAEIAQEGAENELKEEFIMGRIRAGRSIVGTYPLDEAGLREYEAWKKAR